MPLRGEHSAARFELFEDRGAEAAAAMVGVHGAAELHAGAPVAVGMRGDGDQPEADQLLPVPDGDGVGGEIQPRHLQPFADARLLGGLADLLMGVDRVEQRGEGRDVVECERVSSQGDRRGRGVAHGVPPGSR